MFPYTSWCARTENQEGVEDREAELPFMSEKPTRSFLQSCKSKESLFTKKGLIGPRDSDCTVREPAGLKTCISIPLLTKSRVSQFPWLHKSFNTLPTRRLDIDIYTRNALRTSFYISRRHPEKLLP
jgi:hypothetical protein